MQAVVTIESVRTCARIGLFQASQYPKRFFVLWITPQMFAHDQCELDAVGIRRDVGEFELHLLRMPRGTSA